MYSFKKSKLLTLVVFLMTVTGHESFAQLYPPVCPSPEQQAKIQNFCNDNFRLSDRSKDKERRLCIKEETMAICPSNSTNSNDIQCSNLRKQFSESIKNCPEMTCKNVVETCTGDSGSIDDSNSIVNALIIQTTGFNINPSNNGITNCDLSYSDHMSQKATNRTNLKDTQKDIAAEKKAMMTSLDDYNKETRRISEAQRKLKKALDDLDKNTKEETRKKFQAISDSQLKLNDQVRQTNLSIGNLRSQLNKIVNGKKKMLANYDLNNIARVCRGQILKGRAEDCKKNPESCQKIVNTALGSAFTSGGTRTADRNAEFDSCVKNTVLEYSQKIDEASDDIKNMQAQINSQNEALANAQDAQKKNEDFLMQELDQLKADQNKEMQNIAQEYQDLQKELQQEQTSYQSKQMENLRRQAELNGALAMDSSAANSLGVRPRSIGKDLTGSQAMQEISNQDDYRQQAKNLGCCELSDKTGICKEQNGTGKADKKSSSGTSDKPQPR